MIKIILTFAIVTCSIINVLGQEGSETILKDKNQAGITAAQQLIATTGEDLLVGGNAGHSQTVISGYGDFSLTHDFANKNTAGRLDRVVLFVGHQFNKNIAFFSEMEVANARVEGGELLGTVGFEQAYMKFSLNPRQYFHVGLIVPRIGIANELHLPVNFNGTKLPTVEKLLIPSTWSELGVAFYGQSSRFPIQYSIALMNGLDGENFSHGTGFAGGIGAGKSVSFNNLATTASLRAFYGDFQFQVSGYYSGTVASSVYVADSLGIASGILANGLFLGEANLQYHKKAFSAKALLAYVSHPAAQETNVNFANNTPQTMYGVYGELSYDFLYDAQRESMKNRSLIGFVRYENMDLNYEIPASGIYDGTLKQNHFIAGLGYFPTPNVAIKADIRYTQTGAYNPYTVINPPPLLRPYAENNMYLSLGVGYSF